MRIYCYKRHGRRGVQFRIASPLEPFILESFCRNDKSMKSSPSKVMKSFCYELPSQMVEDAECTEVIDSVEARFLHSPGLSSRHLQLLSNLEREGSWALTSILLESASCPDFFTSSSSFQRSLQLRMSMISAHLPKVLTDRTSALETMPGLLVYDV